MRLTILAILAFSATARAQTTLYTIVGEQPEYALGAKLVSLRDVDGDGFDDILTGVPGEGLAGSVRMYSGATGTLLYTLMPGPFPWYYGTDLENLEDVDQDGVPDFAVSDRLETIGILYSGAVHVHSGVDGTQLYVLSGYDVNSDFGRRVARVGDLDLDGASDFLVTAPGDDTFQPAAGPGVVRLFSGRTGALLHAFTGPPIYTFGGAIAGLGDVDLDGRPDFAITSITGGSTRRVEIYSGATFGVLAQIDHAEHLWGSSIAGPGDIDGDGRGDLVVGAPGNTFGYIGEVFVYSGATGTLLYSRFGDSDDDGLGIEVSGVGDLDADGRPDIAAATSTGEYLRIYSGASGATLYTIREHNLYDEMPIRVTSLNDLDGDGRRELAVAEGSFGFDEFFGRIRVIDDASSPPVGAAFCAGDGGAGPCPCGNVATGGAGCANSSGLGARIEGFGSTSVAADTFFLAASQMPANVLTILFEGDQTTGAGGVLTGDGLRCIGGALHRLRTLGTNQNGDSWYGPQLVHHGNWSAGDTRHFQVYYRNPPGPCASGFNVSNAVSVLFTL